MTDAEISRKKHLHQRILMVCRNAYAMVFSLAFKYACTIADDDQPKWKARICHIFQAPSTNKIQVWKVRAGTG